MDDNRHDSDKERLMDLIGRSLPEMTDEAIKVWLDNPQALRNLLLGLNEPFKSGLPKRRFPIWKTIVLGTGLKTDADFQTAFKHNGHKIRDGNSIMSRPGFKVSKSPCKLDLVTVSVEELGFLDGTSYEYICGQARASGLDTCPEEVGPQLRLQYPDQPDGESLFVALEPVFGSKELFFIFLVCRRSGRTWLETHLCRRDAVWPRGCRLVFTPHKR